MARTIMSSGSREPALALIAVAACSLLAAGASAEGRCEPRGGDLRPGLFWGCLRKADRPLARRLELVRHLAGTAGTPAAKDALAALRWHALGAAGALRTAILDALVAHKSLARSLVPSVPTDRRLVSTLRRALRLRPGERARAARLHGSQGPRCVSAGKGRPGIKRPTLPVRCAAKTLAAIKPGDCELQDSRGKIVNIRCKTTLCGGNCMVFKLTATLQIRGPKRVRAAATLRSAGDTGECGCCSD